MSRGRRSVGTSYYARGSHYSATGEPMFSSPEDQANQRRVAAALEEAWACNLHEFGRLMAIDYYAERDGRLVGLVETKTRSHASTQYPDVFLNARKWMALALGEAGMGVPAIYAVEFTDGVRYIRAHEAAGSPIEIAGCSRRVKSHTDIEPVFRVPVERMTALG